MLGDLSKCAQRRDGTDLPPRDPIKITVPLVMRHIIPSGDGIRFEQIDLSNLEQIAIAIAYDRAPFFPVATKSVTDQMRDFNVWGKITRKLVKVQIPQAESEAKR